MLSLQPRPFTLLIKPTSADCNLRCDYCFYLPRQALYPAAKVHRMSLETLELLVASYMATNQPQYAFSWQGGEPTLMGLDFYRKAFELQARLGRPGSVVGNALQTNGVLLDSKWARFLAEHEFLVGLSLDGPAELHDVYRRHASGKGSHAEVLRALKHLQQAHVAFNVLVLVSSANVRHARQVYNYLKELSVFHHQYIPCVEFDEAGRPLPYTITGPQWGDFLCEIFDEWRAAGDTSKVSVRLFDSILTVLVEGRYNVCQMARNCCQYFVVEYNGDVYPCDFFVYPHLKLGNLRENSWLELQQSPVYVNFGRQKTQWNEECKHCPYVKFCSGDCLKHRFYGKDDPRQLSWLCAGWKQFYGHALPYLEVLAEELRAQRY